MGESWMRLASDDLPTAAAVAELAGRNKIF